MENYLLVYKICNFFFTTSVMYLELFMLYIGWKFGNGQIVLKCWISKFLHLFCFFLFGQEKPVKLMERSIYSAKYCFVENHFKRFVWLKQQELEKSITMYQFPYIWFTIEFQNVHSKWFLFVVVWCQAWSM